MPLPSLVHLDELVDRVRRTGTAVRVDRDGPLDSVPPAVDMSAYRIVQEALTNALRHAPGADVAVGVAVDARALTLTIRNSRPSLTSSLATTGSARGSGLIGMAERASVLGGSLEAGPEGDGFLVSACLPLQAHHSPAVDAQARR